MNGKLALVTGASSGIGKATTELLAKRGATVLLLARSGDKLAAVATGIEASGGTAHAYPVDLSDAVARRSATDDRAALPRHLHGDARVHAGDAEARQRPDRLRHLAGVLHRLAERVGLHRGALRASRSAASARRSAPRRAAPASA